MENVDDWGGVAVGGQPKPDDWGGIPINPPKMPDRSGVQRMAQANLTVPKPDSEGSESAPIPTAAQRLDTAMGMPISSMLKGGNKDAPIPAAVRAQYINSVQKGTATDFGDFMQTALHAVVPIASRIAHPIESAESTFGSVGKVLEAGGKGVGAGYEEGTIFPTPVESNVATLFGATANVPFQAMASAFSGTQRILESAGQEAGMPQLGKELALLPEELMGTEGIHMRAPAAVPRLAGPWENLPGVEVLHEPIAQATGKPITAVTPADIDQHIANIAKDKAPAPQDFKAVETVTSGTLNEKTLHVVYKETGVKPDQVFEDAQRNPHIAAEVAAGKVPDVYEHLVEKKPILPEENIEKLQISHDEATKSFTVTDKDGDHVSGGFDSAEEARHYIEDEKFKAEERAAIEAEEKLPTTTEKTPAGEQTVVPGAEKITDKSLAERIMGKLLGSDKTQKPADEGLFDVAGRGQGDLLAQKPKPINVIPPSEKGKVTSLRSFLSNNGAKFNEDNELISIKKNGVVIKGAEALEYANEISKDHGYLPKDESGKPAAPVTDLQNLLTKENGGRTATRVQDADRVAKANEAIEVRKNLDPSKVEEEAHRAGLDTDLVKDETDKQRTSRLLKELTEFYKNQEGSGASDAIRQAIGGVINAAEKFFGKLTGGLFDKLGEAYTKTFQPELMGPLAKRADAFLAKYKAAGQEAENAFYRQFNALIKTWDRKSSDERMEWIYDHETGRWNEEENPDHAQFQALLDATFKSEKEAIGVDAEKGYKDNYLPLQFENEVGVKKFFSSEAMIKKYGADWFTKARTFDLIQDAVRAGFKLKTDNPGRMLVSRLLAGDSMIRTMDLLKDMESSGIAKKATAFSIDKKIAKTEAAIIDLQDKYKKEFEKANDPRQSRMEGVDPATSKKMEIVGKRLDALKERLDAFKKEKADNKLTPEQMKELKGGFRIIGPDSKAWNIHQQAGPLWKNAMEMKGLWENQGLTGDAYRGYMQGKAIWVQVKLGLSLFHPVHVAMIDFASDIAKAADHLIQGGKLSEIATKESLPNMGLTGNTAKLQEHPAVKAWQTHPEARTPEQKQMVERMVEGGLNPTMSARDTVHFKENFDKAIKGVGLNNLRLIGSVISLPGLIMKPFFEHWIPGMKAEIYLHRYQDALNRDPTLVNDAGRRGEMARQIANDTDRTYGEMNNDVQFWNRNLRDSFNAAYISGGWKLAQIYNARGLLQPLNIAYKFAKTGDFSKSDITFNMLHAYAYTGLTLALGGAINSMFGNQLWQSNDTVWDIVKNLVAPKTGEKNPDGTPIRLQQPAFAKEGYMLARDINTKGLLSGAASFLYHTTLIPGIVDTLNNRDFIGRPIISDPTDLHQWMNAGWDAIMPISVAGYEKAESKQSDVGKVAGVLGFPIAGAYMNQTPFEQKVLHTYSEQNPPKGDVYSAKLKSDLKSAIANKDADEINAIKLRMKDEGMTDHEISNAEKIFTKPFVDVAWSKLSSQDQQRLIESASDEEKKKFKVKTH